jgi:cytochrome b involved in lipid metabolism
MIYIMPTASLTLVMVPLQVYDVTNFVHRHPGGEVILSAVGRDATADFNGFGHSDHARSMLGSLEVGQVVMMQTSQNSRKKSSPQKR